MSQTFSNTIAEIKSRAYTLWSSFYSLTAPLFPEQAIFARPFSWRKKLLWLAVLTAVFSILGLVLPAGGLVGFDWIHFFGIGRDIPFYPPWTRPLMDLMTWPLLIGLGLAGFSLAALQRSVHPLSLVAGFLCLPLLWTLFLGQIDGLALLGLVGLPWLAPLALMKPQVTIFAFGAKRIYLLAFLVVLGGSYLVFGPWWNTMFGVESFYAEGRYAQNIGLGWWGLPLFLASVWFSRGDMDMLMLSGSFITPHLIPYNLLPVIPAVSRLRPVYAMVALVLSWLPIICANLFGPWGWWTGWLLPLWLWANLVYLRYKKKTFELNRLSRDH